MRMITLLLPLAACATPPPPAASPRAVAPTPAATAPPAPAPPVAASADHPWTIGTLEAVRDGKPATLQALRTGRNDGFDRVVFELDRAAGYSVTYVDRPAHHCTSGAPLTVEGDALLMITLRPAAAHGETGKPAAPKELTEDLTVLREVEQVCDFEGVASWVVGLSAPNKFRVMELTEPTRLVVDIQH
jgi:hypothetical protein